MTKLNITGYSTALFATWYLVEELGILFDCGDGAAAHLLQKSRKVKHIFISHADRDHLTGLMQVLQLNARQDYPKVYYPADCGSFPKLQAFLQLFDVQTSSTIWEPLVSGQRVALGKDLWMQCIRNGHVVNKGDAMKSLSYHIYQTKRKLKPELAGLGGVAIARLRSEGGEDAVSEEQAEMLISYSGDCPVENDGRWDKVRILIHEATFLWRTEMTELALHGNRHSCLEEVIEMAASLPVLERLILGHFSSRYAAQEIEAAVAQMVERYGLKIPVRLVLPGLCVRNILGEDEAERLLV